MYPKKTKAKVQKKPKQVYEVLVLLSRKDATLLYVRNEAFLLYGKYSRHIPDPVLKVLFSEGWIGMPVELDKQIFRAYIQPKGLAKAEKLVASSQIFHQLQFEEFVPIVPNQLQFDDEELASEVTELS